MLCSRQRVHTVTPGTPQNPLPSPRVSGEQDGSAGGEQRALGAAKLWKDEDGREGEQGAAVEPAPTGGCSQPAACLAACRNGPGKRLLPLPPLPCLSLLPPSLHLPLLSLLAFVSLLSLLFLLLIHAPFPLVSRFRVQLSEHYGGKGDCGEGVPSWANLGVRSTEISLRAGAPPQAGSGCRLSTMGC